MGREAVLALAPAVVVYVLDQLHIFGMITIRGLFGETWLAIALSTMIKITMVTMNAG
jgi:TfoX/Sxy family transcriptional regulator of competence genes